MKSYPNITKLWQRVAKFTANAPAAKKELQKVPRIKRVSYFAAKTKKRKVRLTRINKLEVALAKLREAEHREAWEVDKNLGLTVERCDGYLSAGALKRLFGRR